MENFFRFWLFFSTKPAFTNGQKGIQLVFLFGAPRRLLLLAGCKSYVSEECGRLKTFRDVHLNYFNFNVVWTSFSCPNSLKVPENVGSVVKCLLENQKQTAAKSKSVLYLGQRLILLTSTKREMIFPRHELIPWRHSIGRAPRNRLSRARNFFSSDPAILQCKQFLICTFSLEQQRFRFCKL